VSQNVIGEIKGSDLGDQVLVVSGHHDTVINSSGVDDNGTGVAAVLELARVFANSSPRRTLRFISYGTEEQLSEGAKFYALEAKDVGQIQFILNADAIGGHMGTTWIYYCGPFEIEKTLNEFNESLEFEAHVKRELSPFSDHFPLSCCGIPALWYYRTTYVAARHYHHSTLENLEVISPEVLAKTVRHQAAVLDFLANSDPSPIPRKIPEGQMRVLRKWARDWCGVDSFERK
jgi:Zn-dependent M28 family amino/carboxypeptidase